MIGIRRLLCSLVWGSIALAATARTAADFTLYHTTEQLLTQSAAIQEHNPDYITTTTCAALPELPIYTLTSQQPLSDVGTDKLRLLLNFGEHGRELITSEIALTLLRFLDARSRRLEREQRQAAFDAVEQPAEGSDEYEYERYIDEAGNDLSDAYLAYLLRNTHTTVVPLLNVWGRQQVEAGDVCSRKNKNGVDLNRNYDFMHAHNDKPPHDETYAGTAPFTEPESLCISQLASPPNAAPTVYVNVHSGIQELYFGWDWTASPALPNQREVTRMYEHINSYHCSCKVGAAGKIAGYVVHGGSMDWMYVARNVSYSLTYEVYGDQDAVLGDCYKTFNPQNRENLQDTCSRFATSFFSIMQYLIEEKFGVYFPYRPPTFLRTPLHMTEDKKTRNSVRLFYHTWKQIAARFAGSTRAAAVEAADDSSENSSEISLPAFDLNKLLSSAATAAETRPKTALRVLFIAQNQSNAYFPTELLYHLSHQLRQQSYAGHIHALILPSLFPTSRAAERMCTAGLSDAETAAVAAELYQAEEEVERVSRLVRPHVVVELAMAGPTDEDTETGGEAGKKPRKRLRNDQFDLYHHNDTLSDAAFISSALDSLADVRASRPFTSPLSVSTHLHLRLVYRGYTSPPPDKIAAKRRATDRYPPAHYLPHSPPDTPPQPCDWYLLNPPPSDLADYLTPALHSLHVLLEQLAAGVKRGGWAEVAVREERGEEAEGRGRRAGLFVDDGLGMGVRAGQGRVEWMPSVWESGAGWRGWLVLAGLVSAVVVGGLVGFRWIQKKTRSMKAAVAV